MTNTTIFLLVAFPANQQETQQSLHVPWTQTVYVAADEESGFIKRTFDAHRPLSGKLSTWRLVPAMGNYYQIPLCTVGGLWMKVSEYQASVIRRIAELTAQGKTDAVAQLESYLVELDGHVSTIRYVEATPGIVASTVQFPTGKETSNA